MKPGPASRDLPAFFVHKNDTNMKTQKIILPLMAVTALALGLASCGKNESSTSVSDDMNKAADTAKTEAANSADAAKAEAARVADAAKVEAAKTADAAKVEAAKVEAAKVDAAKATTDAKAEDSAKSQGLIDKARSLVADGKYSDATSILQQLTGHTLSSDQQKLVDALKEQIQKAIAAKAADNAAGSVGDLLKK
jgi:hypothetical protein